MSALCFLLFVSSLRAGAAASDKSHEKRSQTQQTENKKNSFTVVDVEHVYWQSPNAAIKTFAVGKPDRNIRCDVLIAGGGMAAIAAAARIGKDYPRLKVCLTEETSWLGGQMTAQGVSALDENSLVETTGACLSYQTLRQDIRNFYKTNYKLTSTSQNEVYFNPGNCWVTRLAFEPKVALAKVDQLLAAAVSNGNLQIFRREKVVSVDTTRDHLRSVIAVNLDDGQSIRFKPKMCLDATEMGDLLPLASIAYSTGSDSRSQTTEPHAPLVGNKDNVQDFVFPFVVDFRPTTDNSIAKPDHFDQFNHDGKFSFSGYKMFADSIIKSHPSSGQAGSQREVQPFWTYRRLIDKDAFADPLCPFDVAMINWESNDLSGYNIIDQPPSVETERLALGKALSIGFLYWLQNEAPRDDGGNGYKELALIKSAMGSSDGLSMYPYIRESRRIHARTTIIEQDIVASHNPFARAMLRDDSVGIGHYEVDIHGHENVPGTGQQTKPFQIPLGALIPEQGGNLLPAGKTIGVTHITNGAFRLHPTEWAIGEAQGELVGYCIEHEIAPDVVRTKKKHLRAFQRSLLEDGAPIFWFDDVGTSDQSFAAIQFAAVTGLMPTAVDTLHFEPEKNVTVGELALSLSRLLGMNKQNRAEISGGNAARTVDVTDAADVTEAIANCLSGGIFSSKQDWLPERTVPASTLEAISSNHGFPQYKPGDRDAQIKRVDLATWLYAVAKQRRFSD